jgi:hypothetical protein
MERHANPTATRPGLCHKNERTGNVDLSDYGINTIKSTKGKTMRNKSLFIITFLFLVLIGTPAWAAVYYVDQAHPQANDSNSGTEEVLPWKTIGKATSVANAGDTVYIKAGVYNERPIFLNYGDASNKIVIKNFATDRVVISYGIYIPGNYYDISGLEVSPGISAVPKSESIGGPSPTRGQIGISGNHNRLDNIYYHDESRLADDHPALFFGGSYNTVTNVHIEYGNLIHFANYAGGGNNRVSGGTVSYTRERLAVILGDDNIIENIDMHDPGQTLFTGNDADGINIGGRRNIVRNNKIYRCFKMAATQHVDAIQWWTIADDTIIEGNVFGSFETGGIDGGIDRGHIMWEANTAGWTSQRVIIRNNIFIQTGTPYIIAGGEGALPGSADDWIICNNVFRCTGGLRGPGTVVPGSVHRWRIENNIFYANGWNAGPSNADFIMNYNLYVGGAKKGTLDGPDSKEIADVFFIKNDISAAAQYGRNADWHLQAISPAINKGVDLSTYFQTDKDGVLRPQGAGWDIGAYEFVPSQTQTWTLNPGWNWISFNVLPADLTLSSVFANVLTQVEQVKTQTQSAIRSGGTWKGDLADMSGIGQYKMYKVKVSAACALTVSGTALPSATPIQLGGGWNWVAYLPTTAMTIATTLASISGQVQEVKSLTQAATYNGTSWSGTLTQLDPGQGYTIKMSGPGTLIYPGGQ